MSSESKDTFCPLPWTSMALHPTGKAQVCCVSKSIGDTTKNSLVEIWNNDAFKKLRVDMLNGVENNICKSCYAHEKLGINSSRLNWNKIFDTVRTDIASETKVDGTLDRFELKYVDVRFNNLCNFKCRTCDSVYSSRIATESKVKQVLHVNSDDVVSQFKSHYPYLKQIYFAGGEPMIQQEHWTMLSDLIDIGRSQYIDLQYSTNGSTLTFKEHDIIDYWSKFKSVTAMFSIDAMGKQAEYWRDGTVWEDIVANMRRAKTCSNVITSVHSTVGWPNIYSWISFVKYALDTELCGITNISIWYLTSPIEYSLQSIPGFKKEEIKLEIENLIDYVKPIENSQFLTEQLISMIDFMYANDTQNAIILMKGNINKTDDIRGKYLLDYFPEHENMRGYLL